jgi:hypothetical protein
VPRFWDFEGRWRLSRRIENARAPGGGLFEGVAVFTRSGGGLVYEESGELRLPDRPGFAATRRYLWRDDGAGGAEVSFEDGRDFHRVDLSGTVSAAWHDCPPDAYEVSYDFTRWPEWQTVWRVKGPRKDYTMYSQYRR